MADGMEWTMPDLPAEVHADRVQNWPALGVDGARLDGPAVGPSSGWRVGVGRAAGSVRICRAMQCPPYKLTVAAVGADEHYLLSPIPQGHWPIPSHHTACSNPSR